MSIFKKKEKKEEQLEQNKGVIKNKVIIWEEAAGTRSFLETFFVQKWRDEKDNVIFLKNDSKKFLEVSPQQDIDISHYNVSQLEQNIKALEKKIETERTKDDENVNLKNLEYDLLISRKKLRALTNPKRAAFMQFGKAGVKEYEFLKIGADYFPYAINNDVTGIYIPSDVKRKKASMLRGNKDYKYTKHKKLIEGSTLFLLFVGIIMILVGGWLMFKAYNSYTDSEIMNARKECLDVAVDSARISNEISKNTMQIHDKLKDELFRNQTVIVGSMPKVIE